jgi:hypothetical protein
MKCAKMLATLYLEVVLASFKHKGLLAWMAQIREISRKNKHGSASVA